MGESDAIGGMRCDTISYCPSGTCCQGTADHWSCCPYPMVTITISLVSLWSHVNATQGPRSRFDVVVNVYGPPVSGSSERTNHSPCGGYNFSEALAVDARRVRKVRNPLALRQRGTIISPLGYYIAVVIAAINTYGVHHKLCGCERYHM